MERHARAFAGSRESRAYARAGAGASGVTGPAFGSASVPGAADTAAATDATDATDSWLLARSGSAGGGVRTKQTGQASSSARTRSGARARGADAGTGVGAGIGRSECRRRRSAGSVGVRGRLGSRAPRARGRDGSRRLPDGVAAAAAGKAMVDGPGESGDSAGKASMAEGGVGLGERSERDWAMSEQSRDVRRTEDGCVEDRMSRTLWGARGWAEDQSIRPTANDISDSHWMTSAPHASW
jgi:hypothetical protein